MESVITRQVILRTILCFFVVASTSTFAAKGNQFEYELFASYNNSEDELGNYERDRIELGISIFDLSVGYGDYPYLLTNFFERRTHLDLAYTNIDLKSGEIEPVGDIYKINYSFASVGSPLLFNIGAARLEGEGEDLAGDYELDAVYYIFGIGYYVSPNSVAKLDVTAIDYVLSDEPKPDEEYDETRLRASWQHVLKIDTDQYIALLFNVQAIEIGSSKNSNVGGVFDYFVNKKTSFGFGYTAHQGDYNVTEGDELRLRASAFIDEQIGFTVEVSRLFADLTDSDIDSFTLKAIARF